MGNERGLGREKNWERSKRRRVCQKKQQKMVGRKREGVKKKWKGFGLKKNLDGGVHGWKTHKGLSGGWVGWGPWTKEKSAQKKTPSGEKGRGEISMAPGRGKPTGKTKTGRKEVGDGHQGGLGGVTRLHLSRYHEAKTRAEKRTHGLCHKKQKPQRTNNGERQKRKKKVWWGGWAVRKRAPRYFGNRGEKEKNRGTTFSEKLRDSIWANGKATHPPNPHTPTQNWEEENGTTWSDMFWQKEGQR